MTNERKEKIEAVLKKRQNDLTVVLENVFDPHNISAIMRTCDAVGIGEIYVVNTKLPRHEKWGFKSSRSALKWVAVKQFTSVQDCITEVKKAHKTILTTTLTKEATDLYQTNLTESIALVFGNEQNGISNEMMQWSNGNLAIPQVGMLHSLNISVACAVVLYEAFRQKSLTGHYSQQKLTSNEWDNVYADWSAPKMKP